MAHTLAAAGRWVSSSKKAPCPLCGRDTDDKCRRREGVIHCYQGSRFGPPPHLKRGDVLTVEGSQWYVADLAGGFSGAHTVLRPHVSRADFRPAVKQARQRQAANLEPVLLDLFRRVRAWVQAALGIPELRLSTLEEIREARTIVATAAEALAEIRPPLLEARRERPELGRLVSAVDLWAREVRYQQADLELFWRRDLGTPAEAIR